MAEVVRYGGVARALHWLIAALIVAQFVIAEMAEEAAEAAGGALSAQLALYANHKSIGMLVLMLAVVRLGWRFAVPPPALPASMPRWQQLASRAAHAGLYLLILAMPLSGWLYSSAANYSVSFFSLFTWPDLVGPDESLEAVFEEIHHLGARLLFVLAAVHLAAALKHGLWDRDGVLPRMASWASLGAFLALAVIVVYVFGVRYQPAGAPVAGTPAAAASTASGVAAAAAAAPTASSTLPAWQIDPDNSRIVFVGQQAGAPFRGRWTRFEADIRFDERRLAASAARVRIDTASNETGDVERDEVMRNADWFDVDNHPHAVFAAANFSRVGDSLVTDGRLRIGDVERPLPLTFTVTETDAGARVLRGKARIDRLAFGLGRGEWLDTTWVGQHVDVEVLITTRP